MALTRLSQTDAWHVAQDDSDIHGWPLLDRSGDVLGDIVDLVVDTERGEVEALVLDTGGQYPAQDVRLHDEREEAVLHPDGLESGFPEVRRREASPDRVEEGAPAVSGLAAERPGTLTGFADYDGRFRHHYHATYGGSSGRFATHEPAYRHGHAHGSDPANRHREYSAVESELRESYEEEHGEGSFAEVQEAVEHAYESARRGTTAVSGEAAAGAPSGTEASDTVGTSVREDVFRRHFRSNYGSELDEYERYQPAYQHGYRHGTLEEYREQQYEDARPELRERYEEEHGAGTFDDVEEAVAFGYGHAQE